MRERITKGLGLSGVPIDDVSMDEALRCIEEFIAEGGIHQVATANVDYLVNASKDLEYQRSLCMCDIVLADGMPIVWASRLFGVPLRGRVAGADLVPLLVKLAGVKRYKLFLLGATPEVSAVAERRMQTLSPGVRIVGRLSPPVKPLEQFDDNLILGEIERADPDILLVAFGSPKQEKWIARNRRRLKVPVCIGVGASLDFLAGAVRRAPVWMQNAGLEWLFRLCGEPRRLAPRYFKDGVWLLQYVLEQLPQAVAIRSFRERLQVQATPLGSVHVISVSGDMAGSGLSELKAALSSAILRGGPIVLDLARTSNVGADGLRTLAGFVRDASNGGSDVRLCGLSPRLKRTLRATHFQRIFSLSGSLLEAVQQLATGRLQINLELGDNWAVCRVSGEVPAGAHATLEAICHRVRQAHELFEFDASGMVGLDRANILSPLLVAEPATYVGTAGSRGGVGAV